MEVEEDKGDVCNDKLKVDEVDKDVMLNVSRFARA
jgi:hypothetical protein